MSNQGWEALGAGPNMGFLIDRDGKVAVKHGWLDDATMERSIEYFLEQQRKRRLALAAEHRLERRARFLGMEVVRAVAAPVDDAAVGAEDVDALGPRRERAAGGVVHAVDQHRDR